MDQEEIYPGYYRFVPPRKPDEAAEKRVARAFEKAFQQVTVLNTGSGAVAVGDHSIATGEGGVVVKGDVHGGISTGGSSG